MDRRIQKTRDSIFTAFSKLLSNKRYSQITVQEIIDGANIGRSTFYAHFETKDQLLDALCKDIFEHIFSKDLNSEKTHDFSGTNDFEAKVTHILYHLKDSKRDLKSILSFESGDMFWNYFKKYLEKLFQDFVDFSKYKNVPDEFVLNHMAGSFIETVKWWMKDNMKKTPEEMAACFITVISQYHLNEEGMQGYNCILVFHHKENKLLFCKRIKDPYKGLYNLVGGKIEIGENGYDAAYRELEEETGITSDHIELSHMMDFTYYNQNCYVEVYAGKLDSEVGLRKELHPLIWMELTEDFFDSSRFAGEGNIGHMIEQINQYGMGKGKNYV